MAGSSITGQRIGRYELRSLLGVGAMSEVYLATDTWMGRECALKVLALSFRRSPDVVRRFEREARAMASVAHPHVVTIFEIGSAAGIPFIAMEYVPGATLRALIDRSTLATSTIVDVARSIAAGLAGVHRAGIVHRDLKPDNVIVSPTGPTKIFDFGLSKPIVAVPDESEEEDALTLPGTLLGTPPYMSPEQARGAPADFRSDQFSLGAVLFEMAVGVPAFRRDSLTATLAAVENAVPSGLETFREVAPRELQRVVLRLLAKRPEDRYRDMDEVLEALERVDRSLWTRRLTRGAVRLASVVVALRF